MGELCIEYDEARHTLVVTGDISYVVRLPLVKKFVLKHKGSYTASDQLGIPCAGEHLPILVRSFRNTLRKYEIRVAFGKNISASLDEVRRQEERFEEFSAKAASIWQGNYQSHEFSDFVSRVAVACPGRRFYRLQLLSAYHLAFSQNGCNFSVPGAGKTSIVYAAFAYLNSLDPDHQKFVDHILVVGPLSSFKAWEDEFASVFNRSPSVRRIWGGTPPPERRSYLRGYAIQTGAPQLTLTSYATLASNEEDFETFLGAQSRRVMIVLDEAHKIKRADGIWSSSALRLSRLADSRVVLTGTPAPNGYEDLRNLFSFIYPDRDVIGFHNAALSAMTQGLMDDGLKTMKKNIRPYFTRIRKQDFDPPLPVAHEHSIAVPMGLTHKEIYQRIERSIVPQFGGSSAPVSEFMTRARLMRLRQAATNPSLLLQPIEEELGNRVSTDPMMEADHELMRMIRAFSPTNDLAKLKRLSDLVSEIQRRHRKLLIWSIFIRNLDLIAETLKENANWVRIISGSTPVANEDTLPEDEDIETREKLIEEFLSCDGSAILVANPQAVGESISLHKACHASIYFDRDFNAGLFIQSKDRIHRYGLESDSLTEYFYLSTADTVDDDIHSRLLWKEQRMSELIDKEDVPLFRTVLGDELREDILEIISSYERRKSQ